MENIDSGGWLVGSLRSRSISSRLSANWITTKGVVVVVLLERLLNGGINLEIERSLNVNPQNGAIGC